MYQNPVVGNALYFLFICNVDITTSIVTSRISTQAEQVTGCSAKIRRTTKENHQHISMNSVEWFFVLGYLFTSAG